MGLLLGKRQKGLKDYLLSFWFSLILLGIISTYLNHNQIHAWLALFEFTDASVLLHGPVMWVYTLALTDKSFHLERKYFWHLLPFLIATVVLMLPVLAGKSISEAGRNAILVSKMLVLLAYVIAVLWRLKLHEAKIGDYYSFTEKVDLNWLKLLIWGFLVIWIIGATSQFLYYLGVEIPQYGGLYTNSALSLFVLILGYFGIQQTQVFSSQGGQENPESEKRVAHLPKDNTSEFNDGKVLEFRKLEQLMEENKPWLDHELTLYKLAGIMQIPPYQLSQLINQYGGKNFFNFVNQYRVGEVQQRIRAGTHHKQTLLAIALDSGFNSKASFNRVFKKITGKTPRQYATEADQWSGQK